MQPAESAKSSGAYALRVFVRVRPPPPREPPEVSLAVSRRQADGSQCVTVLSPAEGRPDERRRQAAGKSFAFDGVFAPSGPTSTQDAVYGSAVEPQVLWVLGLQ